MNFSYQTGGSLALDAPTYIKRQADEDLYAYLLAGKFCYVLTSRQMGKSSLRIRVMDRLQQSGVRCSAIDLTGIGSQNISASEWYYGILDLVIEHLKLTEAIDLDEFWNQHQNLSPLQRLSKFVDMLLSHIAEPVVVFVDEIDSTINLKFDADDFFIWIRYCFNLRLDKPQYNRLTFCLLGVATPTDLIQDKNRTPFNIGKRIDPQKFQVEQLMPLMDGLAEQFEDIEVVCKAIHDWTGGQPYLTQRLCQLIQSELGKIELGQEKESIAQLVENRIVTNWEYQDEQSHLKTIRDRLLKDDEKAVRLLGFYQQVLKGAELSGDNLPERMALLLTGLVISEQERLFPYNEIYRRVFSDEWVAQELAKLRPHAESLRQWLANSRDKKYLLTGQGFLDVQQWSSNRQLTEEDWQYLAASQKLHTEDVQAKADAIISKATRIRNLSISVGVFGLICSIVASALTLSKSNEVAWQTRIEQASNEALVNFPESSLERTIAAMKVGRELKQKVKGDPIAKYPTYAPLASLRQTISTDWHEVNRLTDHQENLHSIAVSSDGQIIVSAGDKGVKVRQRYGSLIATLGHQGAWHVAVSADGQTIVTSHNKTAKVWRPDGTLIATIKGHRGNIDGLGVSADGQTIVSGSSSNEVKVWRRDGSLITTMWNRGFIFARRLTQGMVRGVAVSADGQTIVAGLGKSVKVWKRDGTPITTIIDPDVGLVSVNANGQTIASVSDRHKVKVWKRDGTLVATLKDHRGEILGLGMSADGNTIVSGSRDNHVKVWRQNGSLVATLTTEENGVYGLGVSADGNIIASGGWDKTVTVWQQNSSLIDEIDAFSGSGSWTGHPPTVVVVSEDGQTIVGSSKEKTGSVIKMWRRDGSFIANIKDSDNEGNIYNVGISADGQTIVSGNEAGMIKLWRRDGSLVATLDRDQYGLRWLQVSADGQTIVGQVTDNNIKVWQRNGSLIATLTGRFGDVSADGQLILFRSEDGAVKVWRRDKSSVTTRIVGDVAGISADGQIIVSRSKDRTVKVWQQNGSLIATLAGHQDGIYGVKISADGQTIVSSGKDRTIKVWRQDGSSIATLTGHEDSLRDFDVSANGKTIVSINENGTIRVWHFDLDYLLAKGCEQLKDYLNSHPEVNREEICPKR